MLSASSKVMEILAWQTCLDLRMLSFRLGFQSFKSGRLHRTSFIPILLASLIGIFALL